MKILHIRNDPDSNDIIMGTFQQATGTPYEYLVYGHFPKINFRDLFTPYNLQIPIIWSFSQNQHQLPGYPGCNL